MKVNYKTCNICKRTISVNNFDRHKCFKKIPPFSPKEEWKVGDNKYKCPYCNKVFKKLGIGNHIYSVHTEEGLEVRRTKSIWNKGLTKETSQRVRNVSIGQLKSNKVGGYHKNLGRGKQGSYKGYWCDSSWELAFVIYHLEHDIKFKKKLEKISLYI